MDETIVTDAAQVSLLLGYLKQHLRLTTNDADVDLGMHLKSALRSVGHDVHRVLTTSTVTSTGRITSQGGQITLRLRGPVHEVRSVTVNGTALVRDEGYTLTGNALTIKGDYQDALVEVVHVAGYQEMPDDMWQAVCLRAAGSYANPLDSVQERQRASDVLVRPYRYKEWQS